MSGLLFLADVIAFVIVCAWTYANSGAGATGETGLLGLKSVAAEEDTKGRAPPPWKRAIGRAPQPAPTAEEPPTPGWRRKLAKRPPWA